MLTITRKLEFDAGHRIPDHKSQCRNLHGHRYTLELTLVGNVIEQEGNSDNGMIMDFSDVKSLAKQHLVDVWDHAFLVYSGDAAVRDFKLICAAEKADLDGAVKTSRSWEMQQSLERKGRFATDVKVDLGFALDGDVGGQRELEAQARGPAAHDGTIVTEHPDELWGTDATTCLTLRDGTATIFDAAVREEEEHADWFESQLEAIKAIGISAYLAQQVDPGSAPS